MKAYRECPAEPVFAPLHEPRHDPAFRSSLDVTTRIGLALAHLAAHGAQLTALATHHATLEDVFLHLTGRSLRDG